MGVVGENEEKFTSPKHPCTIGLIQSSVWRISIPVLFATYGIDISWKKAWALSKPKEKWE